MYVVAVWFYLSVRLGEGRSHSLLLCRSCKILIFYTKYIVYSSTKLRTSTYIRSTYMYYTTYHIYMYIYSMCAV